MSLYKDKKRGVWIARYTHRGKDHKKNLGTDKTQAKLIHDEIMGKLRMDKYTGLDTVGIAFNKQTFEQAAAEFMAGRARLKESTLGTYHDILKNYLLPEFGSMKVTEIRESDVRKFQSSISKKDGIRGKKLGACRVNNIMRLLHGILAQSERDGSINKNPSKHVQALPVRREVDPLSEEELELALAHMDKFWLPLFQTLAFTGARPNEIIALRWKDIDWVNRKIHIRKGRVRGVEGMPKTMSSIRDIPILPQVEQALLAQKERGVVSVDGYIFTDKSGKPIHKHLDRPWNSALKKAGVRHRPSYCLRHSWASICLLKGMSVTYVAKLLGHSTIDTVIRYYARWIEGATVTEEDKLRKLFEPSSNNDTHRKDA